MRVGFKDATNYRRDKALATTIPVRRESPQPRTGAPTMLPAYADKLPATKSSKHNRILFTPSETTAGAGMITIGVDRLATDYALIEFRADGGRGFHLAKLTPGSDKSEEVYAVFIPTCGDPPQCECKGFTYCGHCKHGTAVHHLIQAGEL